MTSPVRATALIAAKAIVIGLVAAVLYLPGLGHAPPYLSHDEALFGIQAQAIATTGRDASGNRLPLYFVEPGYEIGRDPFHVYLTALILQWQPLSESSIRAGAAGVGVVSIMLLFLLARRLFADEWLAWLAAAILALTPVHYFHSRLGLSVIYPIPFVIGWLLCLVIYLERARLGWLAASALVLGAGAYSYLAALVMMPLYAAATAVVLLARRSFVPIVVLAAGFALPLSLLVAWHLSHPGRYGEIVNVYALYDADRLNPLQGLRDMTSYFSLGERVAVYWQAFNPGRWFFTGDGNLAKSTRQVGLFLMPVAILLPIGIVALIRRRTAVGVLLLAGFVTAPLPEVLVGAGEVGRWLVVVPFVVLIATFGAEALWHSGNPKARMALVLLLLAMPIQFAIFHRDYMTGYRERQDRGSAAATPAKPSRPPSGCSRTWRISATARRTSRRSGSSMRWRMVRARLPFLPTTCRLARSRSCRRASVPRSLPLRSTNRRACVLSRPDGNWLPGSPMRMRRRGSWCGRTARPDSER